MDDIQKEAVHPLEAMGISREVVQAFNWMGFHNLTAIQELPSFTAVSRLESK